MLKIAFGPSLFTGLQIDKTKVVTVRIELRILHVLMVVTVFWGPLGLAFGESVGSTPPPSPVPPASNPLSPAKPPKQKKPSPGNSPTDGERKQEKANYRSKATAYYPDNDPMEGGFKDRKGNPLWTLQQYLRGKAPYVSVSMDARAFPYGTKLMIPEFEDHYQQRIEFRVVDTGGAFRGKGTSRIDICVDSRDHIYHPLVNGWLTLIPVH